MYMIKGVECRKLFVTFMKIFNMPFILACNSPIYALLLCLLIYTIYLLFDRFNYFIIAIYTNLF